MAKNYKDIMKQWGIPELSGDAQQILGDLRTTAKEGFGSDYVYDQTLAKTRGITSQAGDKLRSLTGKLSAGSGPLSFGAHKNLEGMMRSQTAGQVASSTLQVEASNEQAKEKAKTSIFNYLLNEQSTATDVMTSWRGMELQKDLSARQLEAQESGCALVSALYGPTSIDEHMLKVWEKMHISINRGKSARRRIWWSWFMGYHWIAPKVVEKSKFGALKSIRESITRRFVRYCARDIYSVRQNPVDVAASLLIGALSTLGWGLKKWQAQHA